MFLLSQIILFASVFCVGWGLGTQQKILREGVDEVVLAETFSYEQTVFDNPGTTSARYEIISEDLKSSPSQWNPQKYADNGTLFDFDDIETKEILTNITTYKNLTFASFKVLNVPLALEAGFVDPEDADAASSPPNALLGSRAFSPSGTVPHIFVASGASDPSDPFPHRFRPLSMRIKPLGFIHENETVEMWIAGWRLKGTEVLGAWKFNIIWFGPGRVGSGWVGFTFWDPEGQGVNVLEVRYLGGERGDWRFVVDDLVVQFLEGEGEGEG